MSGLCSYCGERPAASQDHVVPLSLRRHYSTNRKVEQRPRIPRAFMGLVPACLECNWRKSTRRLVPPAWADKVDAMNEFFGGIPWRVWAGDIRDPVFSRAWVGEVVG